MHDRMDPGNGKHIKPGELQRSAKALKLKFKCRVKTNETAACG